MQRKIITTADGSKTIQISEWDEQYHSKHGAIQETYHVFIKKGLHLFKEGKVTILEIGFGTGLNTLMTLIEAKKMGLAIDYTAVEAYPVNGDEVKQLNYISELKAFDFEGHFDLMHTAPWEKSIFITPDFNLLKQKKDFKEIKDVQSHDLIYFDAFGARVQPELWTEIIFQLMYNALKNNGILVTYAAKGAVRRAMINVGFKVERLEGPPGKREMLRAHKVLP